MSRFFSEKYTELEAYVPGEQPRDQQYIKLNTNENPYPPPPRVTKAVTGESENLRLYSDPECRELRKAMAKQLELKEEELLMTNGSDEILNFAFMAFCDRHIPAVFPDITYGFYRVFAQVNQTLYREIPVDEEMRIRVRDYFQIAGTVFIANPNAPTGIALSRREIEKVLEANPYNVVVVDEAYVDFGAESCLPLIREYDNLLVTQTFSKSRSLAGGRLGFGAANPALIEDLNTIKYSTNPYNVNRLTAVAGIACLQEEKYFRDRCREIQRTRDWCVGEMEKLGFELTDSRANFLFARHEKIGGEELYLRLKARGILVRHFKQERIRDYNRITVGTRPQMEALLATTEKILQEV